MCLSECPGVSLKIWVYLVVTPQTLSKNRVKRLLAFPVCKPLITGNKRYFYSRYTKRKGKKKILDNSGLLIYILWWPEIGISSNLLIENVFFSTWEFIFHFYNTYIFLGCGIIVPWRQVLFCFVLLCLSTMHSGLSFYMWKVRLWGAGKRGRQAGGGSTGGREEQTLKNNAAGEGCDASL